MPKTKKKIAICHYRVGGTDGVSLEIEKRKEILEAMGHEVQLIAGPISKNADHTIKELEWDNGHIPIIKENGFLFFQRNDLENDELKQKINKISFRIEDRLNFIQMKEKFDYLLIHNIFSFGGHIAAAKAFAKWIKKFKIPTLATHHDFYWERKEYQAPRNSYLRHYMEKYMPPKSKYIRHVAINTLAQRELLRRSDIKAEVMPDVFDFGQPPWEQDKFNSDFLAEFNINKNDLVILQATRVIPRKGIEIALDFTKELNRKIRKLCGRRIYNGKVLGKKCRPIIIMAGYAEDEKRDYLFKLKSKAFDLGVDARFISDHVHAKRSFRQGVKTYSLWDAYANADIVTFPSSWEGWGNQFIEAVFAKKPVIIREYPVYQKDIAPEGYEVISLGNGQPLLDKDNLQNIPEKNIKKAVKQTIKWLTDKNTKDKLEKNFRLGDRYHGYDVLKKFLEEQI